MLRDELGQFVDERLSDRLHPFVVGGCQPDGERVRGKDPVPSHHGGLLVELAAQGGGDLDGLDPATEGLRERAVHGTFESLLEAVK